MTIPLMICLLMFMWVPMFAQTSDPETIETGIMPVRTTGVQSDVKKQNPRTCEGKKDSSLLSRLIKTRIVLKDGSMKKNCRIKEMHSYWIVYEKDGSLHDQMIDKIQRIEICDGTMHAVFFDEKNRPLTGSYVY